jgi:mono/diheme cytochrome c family protein
MIRQVWAFTLPLGCLLAACESPPSANNLGEWSPRDHDRTEEQQRIMAGGQPGKAPKRSAEETIAEATWGAKCANCHGMVGHGDGPLGGQVKAPDLTREEWQKTVSDQDIAAIIRNGRNAMPSFAAVGEEAITALVQRIRKTRGAPQ